MEQVQLDALTNAVIHRIFIPLEASGRHVHLTREQCLQLFGRELTEKRPLSQPGQYLSEQRVSLIGPKGRFDNVAVLGPARAEAQVEISLTDSRVLGLTPPIRLSGHTEGSPGIIIEGSCGRIELRQGVIVAQRHLHLTPEDGRRFGVQDKQTVQLQTFTSRPTVFQDVIVRISDRFATAAHLDYDEANACGLRCGDLGRLIP